MKGLESTTIILWGSLGCPSGLFCVVESRFNPSSSKVLWFPHEPFPLCYQSPGSHFGMHVILNTEGNLHLPSPWNGNGWIYDPSHSNRNTGNIMPQDPRMISDEILRALDNLAAIVLGQWELWLCNSEQPTPLSPTVNVGGVQLRSRWWMLWKCLVPTPFQASDLDSPCNKCSHVCSVTAYFLISFNIVSLPFLSFYSFSPLLPCPLEIGNNKHQVLKSIFLAHRKYNTYFLLSLSLCSLKSFALKCHMRTQDRMFIS